MFEKYENYSEELKHCLALQAGDYSHLKYFETKYLALCRKMYTKYRVSYKLMFRQLPIVTLREYYNDCYIPTIIAANQSVKLEKLLNSLKIDVSKWCLYIHLFGYLLRENSKQINRDKKSYIFNSNHIKYSEYFKQQAEYNPEKTYIRRHEQNTLIYAFQMFFYLLLSKRVKLKDLSLIEVKEKLGFKTEKGVLCYYRKNKHVLYSCVKEYAPSYLYVLKDLEL